MDDKFLDKMLDKQEKISEEIHDIKVVLVEQHESLKYHIKRTDLLEESVEKLREEMKPVQSHVYRLQGVLKFFGVLSLVVSIVVGVIKILHFIL